MSKLKKLLEPATKAQAKVARVLEGTPARFDSRGRPRKTTKKYDKYKRLRPKNREVKNKKDLAKLTEEWYDYIRAKGFDDIEWFDPKTGAGQNSRYFTSGSTFAIKKNYSSQTEMHFYMCRNYLTHSTRSTFPSPLHKLVFSLYTEGSSYRDIVRAVKEKADRCKSDKWEPRSIFWVHSHMQKMLADMERWNREHPEGLLNPAQTDCYVEEVLIREPKVEQE